MPPLPLLQGMPTVLRPPATLPSAAVLTAAARPAAALTAAPPTLALSAATASLSLSLAASALALAAAPIFATTLCSTRVRHNIGGLPRAV